MPNSGCKRFIRYEERGIDGGKKTKGRKRHIIVDTLGLLLAIVFHAENEHDSKSTTKGIQLLKDRFSRLIKMIAVGVYRGELI